jgi:hypothetical protein
MASLTDRMINAAKLDVRTYEEVEADQTATGQAMIVVVISSLAAGIGSIGILGLSGVFSITIGALIGWFIWAGVTYLIGTKLLPEPQTKSDLGELLRTIGFSASPGVLRVLGFIPLLGWLISFAASIWMLVAMVIAVRQALDYKSTGRAIGVCVIGFVLQWIVLSTIMIIFGAGRGMTGDSFLF